MLFNIAVAIATLGMIESGLYFWCWLAGDKKDKPSRFTRFAHSLMPFLALIIAALGVIQVIEAIKAGDEVDALKRQVDDLHGGRLTTDQRMKLLHRWKTFRNKEPLSFKRPYDYSTSARLGHDLFELMFISTDWVCTSDDDVPNPTNDMTVFILGRKSSPGLVEIDLAFKEIGIPCKVVIDETLVRENILIAIGCLPKDEPRRKVIVR